MANSAIGATPTNYLYNQNTSSQPVDNSLDKNAFLKILMTQLQNQDPTQPMDDTQFVSQMAQFSSLEQMSNVATSMNNVAQINSMAYGSTLMGNQVTYTATDGTETSGVVTGVKLVNGNVQVQVGDQLVDLTSIDSINSKSSTDATSSGSTNSNSTSTTNPVSANS